jgi:hypothetical protein
VQYLFEAGENPLHINSSLSFLLQLSQALGYAIANANDKSKAETHPTFFSQAMPSTVRYIAGLRRMKAEG